MKRSLDMRGNQAPAAVAVQHPFNILSEGGEPVSYTHLNGFELIAT